MELASATINQPGVGLTRAAPTKDTGFCESQLIHQVTGTAVAAATPYTYPC